MATPRKKPAKPTNIPSRSDPARPLHNNKKEIFAQLVAQGTPVADAYTKAGYSGGNDTRSQLRRAPDVNARIEWLLMDRVRADTARRHKSEKKVGNLRSRVLQELERVAFADVRDIVQWRRVPIVDKDGTVTGYEDVMVVTPSEQLTAAQAAAVREVTTKSGSLKISTHDKNSALEKLCKALGIYSDAAAPPAPSVVVVDSGAEKALEVAKRLAFLLASVDARTPQPLTIEAKAEPEPSK
ncbi:MAG: terminase small subunit [Hyphomicrobiales bacterium]|nr:terminase small subunit [Hyphomicrobiales bacterium]MBV8663101.1 terminase small subunit [Hyphomicrobiales bacterium]